MNTPTVSGCARHLYFCQCGQEVLVPDVILDTGWPIVTMAIWESRHKMPGLFWRIRQARRIMTSGTVDADSIAFEKEDFYKLVATLGEEVIEGQ